MVEPISGTIIAKALSSAKTDADAISPRVWKSVFGPGMDELGKSIGRWVAFKTKNWGRILEKADTKLQITGAEGCVNERAAYTLLEEGSLCDNELMHEYLGGLLAGSKTPDGRDDRAVTWTRTVTALSSLQTRAHYLLYRELAIRLHAEAPEIDLSYRPEMDRATIYLNREEFESLLMAEMENSAEDPEAILRHSLFGLCRAGLVNDSWGYSSSFLRITPTGRGIELYGWLMGISDLLPRNFASRAYEFDISVEIPRLEDVVLLNLYEDEDEDKETAIDDNDFESNDV